MTISGISVSDYPSISVKTTFWENSGFVYYSGVNNNKYSLLVVYNMIFEINVPITPIELLKPFFWNNCEVCLFFSRKQQQISPKYC